jgi:Ion channel
VKHLEGLIFDDASSRVDAFGALLLLTATTIGLLTLVDVGEAAGTVVGTVFALLLAVASAATIVLALQASGVKRRITRMVAVLVAIGVVTVVLVLAIDLFAGYEATDPEARATAPIGYLVFTFVAPFVVVRRLIRQGEVTVKTLTGAVTAYLLIALSFNYVFLTVDSLASTPFFGTPEPTTSFMYFSLVTITTLGYGDLAPAPPWGRLTAAGEAVIGQVFLVTVVALVVGLLAQRRER